MTSVSGSQPPHDPVEASLTSADDHVRLDHWLPPQIGVVPRVRIGRRWVNVLWIIPIGFVVLVLGVAIAQALRELPAVQDFVARYPGVPASVQPVISGFPVWLSVQRIGTTMAGPFNALTEWWDPKSQLTEKDISPYFWLNGTMPKSDEFDALVADDFASYKLRVSGLVKTPKVFSYAELKAMPKQEQITTHFCIQGWSGVAKGRGSYASHS